MVRRLEHRGTTVGGRQLIRLARHYAPPALVQVRQQGGPEAALRRQRQAGTLQGCGLATGRRRSVFGSQQEGGHSLLLECLEETTESTWDHPGGAS